MRFIISKFRTVIRKIRQQIFLPGRVQIHRNAADDPATYAQLRERTLSFVESCRGKNPGEYSFVPGGPPLAYASAYAALTLDLYGELESLDPAIRKQWGEYLASFQREDGWFTEPHFEQESFFKEDWWGARHMTLHITSALHVLGVRPNHPFRMLEPLKSPGAMVKWLEERDWNRGAAFVSNEVQNWCTLLQVEEVMFGTTDGRTALGEMYDWLDAHQDADTGLWGETFDGAYNLSQGVQAGYHFWTLYFYDRRPVQHLERVIDSLLATQNRFGGFGVDASSSACEDIDTIDPLVRLVHQTDYRREKMIAALERSVPWVLSNFNPDGGAVFRRYVPLNYGAPEMSTPADRSSLFPTWFRTLSLAYLAEALPEHAVASIPWRLPECPGYQYSTPRAR